MLRYRSIIHPDLEIRTNQTRPSMIYQQRIREFIESSQTEIERLKNQIQEISEIIDRLQRMEETESTQHSDPTQDLSPPPSPTLLPHLPIDERAEKNKKSVGDIAESLLKEQKVAMSLEELYQNMKDRKDIHSSSDLKNAIRVGLIRRRPRVISERRGWFRYVGGSGH